MPRNLVLSLALPVLLLPAAGAQDPHDPAPKDERAAQLLRAAVQKMAGLPSFGLRATESHKDPVRAGLAALGGGAEEQVVEAVFGPEFATASIGDGDHEVVFHQGRMAVQSAPGSWVLRKGLLADGASLPFIVDPVALWSVLDRLAGSATSGGPATVRDVQVETVRLDVAGDLARELAWTGAFPLPRAGLGGVAFFAIGGGGFKQPPPDLKYQIEVAIDPTSRFIQRIKASAQRLDGAGGGHVVFMGAGQEEEEEEEETEEGEPKEKGEPEKARAKQAGKVARTVTLFGRRGGDGEEGEGKQPKPSLSFEMSFRDHGTATPEVSAAARATLQFAPAREPGTSDK